MGSFSRSKFIEIIAGPFDEPRRPHPIVDAATARQRCDELETLLAQLEESRRRSWRFAPLVGLAWIVLLLSLSGFRASAGEVAVFIVFGLVVGVWDNVAYWLSWPGGSRTLTTIVVRNAPSYDSILAAAYSVHDAILGLPDSQRRELLGNLIESHPRVYEGALVSWTLVPTSLKVELANRPGLA